jgi:hypothetical protein
MSRALTNDSDAITLKDAASHFGYTVCTLRAEADRGRLTIYKIGKRYYTTPADIKEMVAQCRVVQKVHGYTSIRREINGSSETERVSSALAAAQETMLKLRNSSPRTSAKSISPNRPVRQ